MNGLGAEGHIKLNQAKFKREENLASLGVKKREAIMLNDNKHNLDFNPNPGY